MTGLKPWLATTALLLATCGRPVAMVDGSQTEVSAERRLSDYLKAAIYPPENRILEADDAPLQNIPTVAGDASEAATIIGFVGEKLRQGSLEVTFRVHVRSAGLYSFRTNLCDNQGKPRIQAMLTRELSAGTHTLPFFFYGKAIRERAGEGGYLVQGILGEKIPGADNIQGRLKYYSDTFAVKRRKPQDFTTAVWNSPEKQRRIKELQHEIDLERRPR